jgi:hypothetical protein
MPAGNLVSLPPSLSRSGNTLVNLRGIIEGGKAFNYIPQAVVNPTVANISRVTTSLNSNSGGWTSTIRYAFEPDAEGTFSYIDFGKPISIDTSFTILFRILCKELTDSNVVPYIFFNGDIFNFSGYIIQYDAIQQNISFGIASNPEGGPVFGLVTLNTTPIVTNTWYHYGIRVTTSGGTTVMNWWQNGGVKQTSNLGFEFLAPGGGGAKLMNDPSNYAPFYGKLTDFVFLNGASLTDSQMAAFGTAPFV